MAPIKYQSETVDYESKDCGKDTGTATQPNNVSGDYDISINLNTDLSQCIVGPKDAKVYSIHVATTAMSDPFEVHLNLTVNAQGPSGAFSGGLELEFTDFSRDTYSLNITDSNRKDHTLWFNTRGPGITKITWRHVWYVAKES